LILPNLHFITRARRALLRFCQIDMPVVHALRQPDHVAVNEILVEPRDEPV